MDKVMCVQGGFTAYLIVSHEEIQHRARLSVSEGLYSAHGMRALVRPHDCFYALSTLALRRRKGKGRAVVMGLLVEKGVLGGKGSTSGIWSVNGV